MAVSKEYITEDFTIKYESPTLEELIQKVQEKDFKKEYMGCFEEALEKGSSFMRVDRNGNIKRVPKEDVING